MLTDEFVSRASRLLNLADYGHDVSSPVPVFSRGRWSPPGASSQYILRMMVRSPSSGGLAIPESLRWLSQMIIACNSAQRLHGFDNPYVYVTVRHGEVSSVTDDSWHVDGFSMRVPHLPEQSYISSSNYATQWQDRTFPIPESFDPLSHNMHDYLASVSSDETARECEPWQVYAIDPYCVHRRPPASRGQSRTFWRISFVPIEIEDDTCTPNPLLETKRYNRRDFRERLTQWVLVTEN